MYFAVTQQAGPEWDGSRPMREQQGWPEHAGFIDGLAAEGFLHLAGPLGDTSGYLDHVHRTLLVVEADSEDAVRSRFAADPWIRLGFLTISGIDRWEVLVGDPAGG